MKGYNPIPSKGKKENYFGATGGRRGRKESKKK
jgi:hypothetical protein